MLSTAQAPVSLGYFEATRKSAAKASRARERKASVAMAAGVGLASNPPWSKPGAAGAAGAVGAFGDGSEAQQRAQAPHLLRAAFHSALDRIEAERRKVGPLNPEGPGGDPGGGGL